MRYLVLLIALSSLALPVSGGTFWGENYDESVAGPSPLQDPLVFADGRKVVTAEDWRARREEIVGIFAREMYGQPPPSPECVETELVDEKVTVSGFAVRRRYRMWFRKDRSGPCVNWICFLPRHAVKPVPVILFLNYRGNFELVNDKDIPVGDFYVPYAEGNRPSPERRGIQQDPEYSFSFPIGMILARGYAVMSACNGEVSPDPAWQDRGAPDGRDDPRAYTGVFDLWPKRDDSRTDNITSLGAWAWALSRGLDLAVSIPEIDTRKSVVTGCSRLAKAALLAAVRDERFSVCVPIQTGGGGCPLAKHYYGENVRILVKAFPHWFCKAYEKYAEKESEMPFDQHLLLACIAPRGLLVEGFDDPWYDTKGEYMAVRAASPVWAFLGKGGLPDVPWPKAYETKAIGRDLGYVHRTEKHGIAPHDWKWMLDFADGIFTRKSVEKKSGGICGKRPPSHPCEADSAHALFMRMMGEKASMLGTEAAYYENASGLTKKSRVTTSDLLEIGLAAARHPVLSQIWATTNRTVAIGGPHARREKVVHGYTTLKGYRAFVRKYPFLGGKGGSLSYDDLSVRAHVILTEVLGSRLLIAIAGQRCEDDPFALDLEICERVAAMLSGRDVPPSPGLVALEAKRGAYAFATLDGSLCHESREAHRLQVPASTTKILTALCCLDVVKDISQTLTVRACDIVNGSGYKCYDGDVITYEDALYSMMLPSSNTMAECVATATGGLLGNERQKTVH